MLSPRKRQSRAKVKSPGESQDTGEVRLVGEAFMLCVVDGKTWPRNEDELVETAPL